MTLGAEDVEYNFAELIDRLKAYVENNSEIEEGSDTWQILHTLITLG